MTKANINQQQWIAYLQAAQAIDDLQAEQARSLADTKGVTVWQALADEGILTVSAQLAVLAHSLDTEVVELQESTIRKIAGLIPAKEAYIFQCLPVKDTPDELWIAVADPFSKTLAALEFITKKMIKAVLADPEDLMLLLPKIYPQAEAVVPIAKHAAAPADFQAIFSNASPVAKAVNAILEQAVMEKASDVHFEPFESTFKVRFRVDGALHQVKALPLSLASPMLSRIKVMADLDIAEKRKPQDGRLKFKGQLRAVDMRVSCLPTQYGESVVLRILDKAAFSPSLQELGLRPQDLDRLGVVLEQPNGIVLVTGPTGSGKTTTLYSFLQVLNQPDIKILTAEDPVEYEVKGLIQVPIKEDIGLSFNKILRSFLRQDPDIIMIGEMRDVDTAQIAIQSSLTGHLVLSTLHTNNAPASITRLLDMGVEPFLLASTLSCVLAQRLVRTTCKNCRKPIIPDEKDLRRIGFSPEDVASRTFYKGSGCKNCGSSGYSGRRGLFELMVVEENLRQMIADSEPTPLIRQKAIELGMTTLRADGIRNLLAGDTTLEEVLRYT